MWRPDLHPLPCRRKVDQRTGPDGRHSYAVREAVPSGTVLEISVCLEMSLIVVDQFPYVWDFVLTGKMENECIGRLFPTDFCLLTRTHRLLRVLQIKAKEISGNVPNGFCISFIHSLSANTQARHHPKPPRPYDLGLRLGLGFLRLYGAEVWVYASIKSICTRSTSICTNQTSAPSRTHAIQQCSHPQFNTSTGTMHA